MLNEWDLQVAIVAIAEADTGPGGLVPLHGRPQPVVEWGDEGMGKRPVTALFLDTARADRSLAGEIRLSILVGPGEAGLESRILDRWEEVLTTPALKAHGIDGIIRWTARPDLTELTSSGKRRDLEGTFTITRK